MRKFLGLVTIIVLGMHHKTECQKYYGGDEGKKLDWAISYIKDYYVDSLNYGVLVDDAIKSFVTHLDPNSVYETKEEAELRLNKDKGISPKSTGFKFYFIDANTAVISRITPGGPAEKAGLRRGYILNKVNGIIFNNDTYDDVTDILENPDVDNLEVSFVDFDRQTQTVSFSKGSAPWYSVLSHYMLDYQTGYIKLRRFNSNTVKEVISAIDALKSGGMKNLILDMRNNNGGVKDASIELADHFLPSDKLITYTGGHNLEGEKFYSSEKNGYLKGKLICLTDDYTASASEIFLGALQDWDRCLVMGDLSYGKGTIQQSYKLGDGSTIRITIGRYYTPTGRHLNKLDKESWLESHGSKLVSGKQTNSIDLHPQYIGKTKSGRKIVIADGGIVPDVFFKAEPEDRSLIKSLDRKGNLYRFAASYVFNHRKKMVEKYSSPSHFRKDDSFAETITPDLITFYKQRGFEEVNDPNLVIPDNLHAQLKTWMADFIWGDAGYYELQNADDQLINEALRVMDSDIFKSLGINQ